GRRGKGRVREPRWWVGRRSGGRSLGRTPCRLVLPRRPAIRANDSQLAREVVHIAASPGHLKPLVANLAGVDRDFGVADVVELDAVFESVGNVPDDLPAVFRVIAGTQHHRPDKFALAAGDHLMCRFGRPYVDGIEAIQVDEFTVFRQHPHRVSPSLVERIMTVRLMMGPPRPGTAPTNDPAPDLLWQKISRQPQSPRGRNAP